MRKKKGRESYMKHMCFVFTGGWPIPNMICPPGLEYLMGLDHLFVKQKFEMLEGW